MFLVVLSHMMKILIVLIDCLRVLRTENKRRVLCSWVGINMVVVVSLTSDIGYCVEFIDAFDNHCFGRSG